MTYVVATWTLQGRLNTRVFRADDPQEMAYLAGLRDGLHTAGVTVGEATLEVAA